MNFFLEEFGPLVERIRHAIGANGPALYHVSQAERELINKRLDEHINALESKHDEIVQELESMEKDLGHAIFENMPVKKQTN